ncbi:HD-GYP domain-containing protein [Deinococcus metallilatus]|uniref:HD-GYP domain-containing protein (C-di-GMP phosphodiesterase class II) n=1 Tax=Deinococcus metallilatus TaxID=1211322 RepID=A0ABR6MYX4_9DEIO|nr:HD-GYP domain-containing protein [Deinococcus metallilatus]MBB5296560.1 HD-GYP domain-containing protein (c-di-GMP phosphodiesterase class II) [Deinococcus metallilatus]GMA17478.1 phosphohydrolase [Deinococcus metallilatus]
MIHKPTLSSLGLVLGLGALAYAAVTGQPGLLAGAAVLLNVLAGSRGDGWRWAALAAYPVAFGASMLRPGAVLHLPELVGALLVLGTLGVLTVQGGATVRELAWRRKTFQALQTGSEQLAEARDAAAIIRAGVDILDRLEVAPHLAFVAYRQGTPYLLAARGAFAQHLERPIQPSDDDSRSVQADHWVAEEVLALLSREERPHHHVVPVYDAAQRHLGMLILARPSRAFGGEAAAVVASFARLLGAQLGQWQAIRDLREANDVTLRSLGAALERRDDDTGGHTLRVVGASVRLAQRLGWDEDRVKALRWGAYLHDLGKLAIPDRVLHKCGPLDPEERRIIQRHPVIGYDLLQDLHFLPAETLDLVRCHHERWDGSGYPAGLRGQDIPETARLFAIVDVYDALTSTRPYKAAWTHERALDEIRWQAGRQFDPRYVDAFLRLMAEQDDVRLVS